MEKLKVDRQILTAHISSVISFTTLYYNHHQSKNRFIAHKQILISLYRFETGQAEYPNTNKEKRQLEAVKDPQANDKAPENNHN